MILLNMMIGAMELLIGVIVLIAVLTIEVLFISKRLSNNWVDMYILKIIILSNIVSTLAGLHLSGIWNELVKVIKAILDLSQDFTSQYFEIGFFMTAFLLTLLIEIPFNIISFKSYNNRAIIISTLYANILTYVLIGLLTLMSLV